MFQTELSDIRVGKITSSGVVDLIGFDRTKKNPSATFYSYVEQKKGELFLNKTTESNVVSAKPMQWGKICEDFVARNYLTIDHIYQSVFKDIFGTSSIIHSSIENWLGTPDYYKEGVDDNDKTYIDVVGDIKSPFTLSGFLDLVMPLYNVWTRELLKITGNQAIEIIKETTLGKKYYWQLVSNSILLNCNRGELMVFMPNDVTLNEIIAYNITNYDPPVNFLEVHNSDEIYRRLLDGDKEVIPVLGESLRWTKFKDLPHISKELELPEIHTITFDIPQSDKDFLTERVKMALELIYN